MAAFHPLRTFTYLLANDAMVVIRRLSVLLLALPLWTGCSTSPVPVLEPWPFKEDQVVISCENYATGNTGDPVSPGVFVTGSDGVRYAANDSARAAVAFYMSPLLAEPDQGQVVREGLRLCENGWPPTSYRRRALIEMG